MISMHIYLINDMPSAAVKSNAVQHRLQQTAAISERRRVDRREAGPVRAPVPDPEDGYFSIVWGFRVISLANPINNGVIIIATSRVWFAVRMIDFL